MTIFHEDVELKNAATRMGSIEQSMKNIENAVVRVGDRLSPFWKGKASDQNTRNFQKLHQMMDKYLTDASKTRIALNEAVASYEKTERAQVVKVSQLDTKGIF